MSLLPLSALPTSLHVTLSLVAAAAAEFRRGSARSLLPFYASQVCDAFEEALSGSSPITMLPNYEISPRGDESGDFLVVDLGGSTLRVAVISIAPESGPRHLRKSRHSRQQRISLVVSRSWPVENGHKLVNRAFFSWIAAKIAETLAAQTAVRTDVPITTGITWSFPLRSTLYNTATILHLAKGFLAADDIVGCELKALLEATVSANHAICLDVQLITNDSLAVFSAARFLDQSTRLALVLGTGFNLCCQLRALARIAPSKLLSDEHHVLFNTETSLFGNSLVPALATKYDCYIDPRFADSLLFAPHMAVDPATNAIFQPFELLTSGRYLPELVRLVLLDAVAQNEIFAAQKNFAVLATPYQGVTGELMCLVAEGTDDSFLAERIEACFRWPRLLVTLADVADFKLVVQSIVHRAAYVVAVAIVAYVELLARHNGPFDTDVISIGYVGSVMEYFGSLRTAVLDFVNGCPLVASHGVQVKLEFVHESSLVGTAIAAASQCARLK
ncbi:actin-like ATPase domain-containing protein [Metschnikowia bicuspidata var. bicuspidata NRRL YB-4993]|uniref:Phosphotransferase n=1 Tax=Metschnikowia bicuspidata var. bicuspidata NRRL YB-4993 TaxID=869754 RepID=A0A1A0HA69_9ASCO|nr:actin-like ATPase domain-containing protein [Metschnikowia bicuspidata var. bicuspidata NRRL YB-4993]OBA20772.1 actin-like ATPase domain-containing protein [Metschnikowia bicuspidata var. bicuspidata NRRL YB-4993]